LRKRSRLEKAIRVTRSECVSVALVIQHVRRMRLIILSSAICSALPYIFPHYLINGMISGGGGGGRMLFNIKFILILFAIFV
jgi:hypothetical protein